MVRRKFLCDFSRSSTSPTSGFLVFQFFVEDPGGSAPDVLTTSAPEVLISAPPPNRINDSLFDYREENAAEIKFYLPVSALNGFSVIKVLVNPRKVILWRCIN